MALSHILQPITINKLVVKNRILRPAHGTNYGRLSINDDLVAYHEARAKSGVGLSTLEATVVHPSAGGDTVFATNDTIIPGFRSLADAVHRHGMKMFVQLWHAGHHWPPLDGSPAVSASDVPSPWGPVPVPMSVELIADVTAGYASAARRVRDGGLDGVEVHFGHGYLIQQFLSPMTNLRDDEYGGNLENRMRFGVGVLKAVRGAVGSDFPVGIRISDAHVPGGVTVEECVEIVESLCAQGLVDFVNASMGSYHDTPSMLPAMHTPVGAMLPSSGPIAAAATVPRMIAGRYRTLEEADQAIREGVADMVGIARAMIADPDLVRKTLDGHPERVRPCLGCNQGCIGGILSSVRRMGCVVNPTVGFERTLHEDLVARAESPKKVMVIGGGAAGMEAARLAALSGHHVTLCEAGSRLGGAVNIARRAPKLQGLADITVWLEQEVYRLGVDVRLSTFAEADDVLAENPDFVIVATGSLPRMDGVQGWTPGFPTTGFDKPHVYSSHDVFDVPRAKLGTHALVLDDIGHYEAIGVAEYFIEQGLTVAYLTRHANFAPFIELIQRAGPALQRLRRGDFSMHLRSRLAEIGDRKCKVAPLNEETFFEIPADVVVLVTANRSQRGLYEALRPLAAGRFGLKLAGDANTPRDLQAAIHDGHMAGRFLEKAA